MLSGALNMAKMGIIPAGAYRNRDYVGEAVRFSGIDQAVEDILFDPQTSGGLLLTVPETKAAQLELALREHGAMWAAAVGRVISSPEVTISVKPQ
jgi:selenide,water dikinase